MVKNFANGRHMIRVFFAAKIQLMLFVDENSRGNEATTDARTGQTPDKFIHANCMQVILRLAAAGQREISCQKSPLFVCDVYNIRANRNVDAKTRCACTDANLQLTRTDIIRPAPSDTTAPGERAGNQRRVQFSDDCLCSI